MFPLLEPLVEVAELKRHVILVLGEAFGTQGVVVDYFFLLNKVVGYHLEIVGVLVLQIVFSQVNELHGRNLVFLN